MPRYKNLADRMAASGRVGKSLLGNEQGNGARIQSSLPARAACWRLACPAVHRRAASRPWRRAARALYGLTSGSAVLNVRNVMSFDVLKHPSLLGDAAQPPARSQPIIVVTGSGTVTALRKAEFAS